MRVDRFPPTEHDPAGGASPRPLSPARATAVAVAVIFVAMSLFEIAKDVALPQLSKQESHVLTVCFTTALAALVGYALFRRQDALQRVAERESRERQRLDEARRVLEQRTEALEVSRAALEVEIAERERTQAALRAQEQRLAALIDAIPDLLYLVSEDGTILDAHVPKDVEWVATQRIAAGAPVRSALPPDAAALVLDRVTTCLATRTLQAAEFPIVRAEGTRHVEARFAPMGDDAVLVLARDLTEQRTLEEGLQRAQRMDSLGRLAGGVAHDFNNLLTAIIAHVDFGVETLDGATGADEASVVALREDLASIRHASTLAANLTRQLLSFARRQIVEPRVVGLNRLVRELEHMLRRTVGATIDLQVRLAGADLPVLADPGQLEQVLVNLVVNARDAMPSGGTLAIALTRDDERRRACLEVRDSGAGMTDAVRARIFEPFFSTKEAGRGAGLGLAICYGVVSRAGGQIDVESAPGRGTTVSVWLPLSEAPLPPPVPEFAGARTLASRALLLVEDEPSVRRLARRSLEQAGAHVLEAEDGEHALEVLARTTRTMDAVVTDVVMPRLGGFELADRLRRTRPAIPIVFTSGYLPDTISADDLHASGAGFVPKPFSPAELVRVVSEAVHAAERLSH